MIQLKCCAIKNKALACLLFLATTDISSQGKWEALGSPVASNIYKMISTTDKKLFVMMPYSGIRFSEDLGEHWTTINDGLIEKVFRTPFIAGLNGSVLLATEDKIYRLKDVHSSWELMNYSGGIVYALYLGANNRLFCISDNRIYVSDDEGLHFNLFLQSPVMYGKITNLVYSGNDENYFVDYTSLDSKLFKFDNQALKIDSVTIFKGEVTDLIVHPQGNLFMYSNYDRRIYQFSKITYKRDDIVIDHSTGYKLRGRLLIDSYNNLIGIDSLNYISRDGGLNWNTLTKPNFNLGISPSNSLFLDSLLFVYTANLYNYYCEKTLFYKLKYFDSGFKDLSDVFTDPDIYSFDKDAGQLFVSGCITYPFKYYSFKQSSDDGNSWTDLKVFGEDVINFKINHSKKYYALCGDTTYTSIDQGKNWTPLLSKISPYSNFFFSADNEIYITNQGPYLTRLNEDGSNSTFVDPTICCDGDIWSLLFHPNGRIYINWGADLLYSDEKGEHAKYNHKNFMKCWSCDLSSLGDLYNIDEGFNYIEPDLSDKHLIEPLAYRAQLVGHDHANNVFVYDPEKGLLQCNRNGCHPFDMTGLPFPYLFIRSIYQDENNFLYAGLHNDKIYKYNQPVVSNKNPVAEKPEALAIFPNPFTSSLNCEVKPSQNGSYRVSIQDIFGRTIYQSVEKQSHFSIETELMQSGIYFIRVNNSIFQKIVKL